MDADAESVFFMSSRRVPVVSVESSCVKGGAENDSNDKSRLLRLPCRGGIMQQAKLRVRTVYIPGGIGKCKCASRFALEPADYLHANRWLTREIRWINGELCH